MSYCHGTGASSTPQSQPDANHAAVLGGCLPETILSAGKRIAAIASGRAFKEDTPKGQPEEPSDTDPAKLAAKESGIDPGNPNDINHDDQQPGQEKA
jgi:hypothetical protein